MARSIAAGVLVIISCMIPVGADAEIPVGPKKWREGAVYRSLIGGRVRNYRVDDSTWSMIDNSFVSDGDSVVCLTAAIKTGVTSSGRSTVTISYQGNDYTAVQRLVGIGWLNISSRTSGWIDSTMVFSSPAVDSNAVFFSGVSPGVDYRILKGNGRVEHAILFKPAFLDSAVSLYNMRSDSSDLALANIFIYTLSATMDNPDSAYGAVRFRKLRTIGDRVFGLSSQHLYFPDYEAHPAIEVRQYWERRGSSLICLEYVLMSAVKAVHELYPAATLWHNSSTTLDDTNGTNFDTWLNAGGSALNYGATAYRHANGLNSDPFLMRINTDVISGPVTVSACSLYIRIGGGTNTWSVRRVTTSWVEGNRDGSIPGAEPGATFDQASDGGFMNDTMWADGGDWGSQDYVASDAASESLTGFGYVYLTGAQLASDMEDFINDTYPWKCWVVYSNSLTQTLHSSDSDGKEPYIVVVYSQSATSTSGRRRRITRGL